eukprot:CAMPEP_0175989134 /NCGR_PEP_ID=MMETSP0108-20121206/51608_1 /TAXON_ID=195067 ORGANISM="Goniomonas pacifica, Strain CCMP1869" /NCGR_SAMPLE_ID=MMETSP0108 /ASSEMBLY_ACC=CAM_ASM_000204 /LENGTH=82 /DNA_ID=CAMNT_0017320513 /DNA_START=64 /DNA_END=310 /DNA_ORIENTATION=+
MRDEACHAPPCQFKLTNTPQCIRYKRCVVIIGEGKTFGAAVRSDDGASGVPPSVSESLLPRAERGGPESGCARLTMPRSGLF